MSQTPSLEISSAAVNDEAPSPFSNTSLLKKIITNGAKIALTAGILYYLYSKGMLDLSRVGAVLKRPSVFGLLFSLALLNAFFGVLRWKLLLDGQGIHIGFLQCTRLTMIGVFFNTALPGAVSGDVVKGYYVVRMQPKGAWRIKALATLLLDRILGLSALIFVAFFAMALNMKSLLAIAKLKPLCVFVGSLWLGVVLFFALVLFDSKFVRFVQKMLTRLPMGLHFSRLIDAVKAYERSRRNVYWGALISLGIHTITISTLWILARALGGFEAVHISQFLFLAPIGLLVTAIPIAPAGLGTGNYAFYFLMSLVGPKNGADLFTGFVTFQILMSLIGGVFYLRYRHHKKA